jgi:hypothetical protein
MIGTILVIIAAILFLLAAINFPANSPISLGWLGAFFFALASVVGGLSS